MTRRPALALGLALAAAAPAAALVLDMPTLASPVAGDARALDSTAIATGPWRADGGGMIHPQGAVRIDAWRIEDPGPTTLQILAPLAAQVEAAGWEILLSCADTACGGFDFRHALEVLPAPQMHVSLGDFRYLSARKDGAHLAILVSRAGQRGYVQVTRVGPREDTLPGLAAGSGAAALPGQPIGDFAARLEAEGRVVLSDLDFATGAAELGPGRFASLRALADYLAARPGRTVALVGHTDARGTLEGNVALSRRRAQSVVERLVAEFGVDPARLRAEGMGYLAPLTTNLTPEGREANRRVEVILTSVD